MGWHPSDAVSIQEFTNGWFRAPFDKSPIYSEQLFTEQEALELFFDVLHEYPRRAFHKVYKDNGTEGHVDRRVRDTHDLSRAHELLTARGISDKLKAASSRGAEYITGMRGSLEPSVELQVLGYERRGRFIQHADSHIWVKRDEAMVWEHNNPERKLSGICWLSGYKREPTKPNEFNGGKIKFPFLLDDSGTETVIEPKAGQFVLFPSHPLYSHEVIPTVRGYRMALVTFYDVKAL